MAKLSAELLEHIAPFIQAGISTLEIDQICSKWIKEHGAIAGPLNYKGFPKSICTSINDVVCHGIPKREDVLKNGDIINVDIALIFDNYYGDTSRTFMIGDVNPEAKKLVEVTQKSLMKAIMNVRPGERINVIGNTIEGYVGRYGYSVVTDLGGHGIGKHFHEEPCVFHHQKKEKGVILKEGMTFTIEPMINQGKKDVFTDPYDKWTVHTLDGLLSAQFEHTVLVTSKGAEILTIKG